MDRRRQDRRVPALTLHVTNGDAVAPAIAAVTGEDVLPRRDVLHDGPVPAGLDADAPDRAAFAALRSPYPRAWLAHPSFARLLEELPDPRTGLGRLGEPPRPVPDRWLGGVRLPGWAWDRERGSVLRTS